MAFLVIVLVFAALCGAARAGDPHRVSADFDLDGYGDLVIGVPYEDIEPETNAGAVNIITGYTSGLDSIENQVWYQNAPGVAGASESGDLFGYAVAVGDFDLDGFDDMAVGVPLEEISGFGAAGAIHIFYGSLFGIATDREVLLHQGSDGMLGVLEAGDRFGSSFAVGDFNADGHSDLAVGAPMEDVSGIDEAGGDRPRPRPALVPREHRRPRHPGFCDTIAL